MIVFVHSTDGMNVDSGISLASRDGWVECLYDPPKAEADEICQCEGFIRDGDSFKAIFRKFKIEIEEDVSDKDKDAALRRFGVEV